MISCGAGIRCFRDLHSILDYCVESQFQVVVQRYISRPLLIRKRKVRSMMERVRGRNEYPDTFDGTMAG